jgi:DNA-binding GntR family transcriptional regulator
MSSGQTGKPKEKRLQGSATPLDRRRSVSDQLYEHLRRLIVTLELRPGEIISEPEISQRFGVSRTPLREALIRLSQEELVVIIPQFGSFVSAIDADAVRQVQFLRENLEVAVGVKLAGIEGLDLTAARLMIPQQQLMAKAQSYWSFIPLDDRFHELLFEAAGMDRIWTFIQAKKAHLDRIRVLHTPEPGKLDEVIAQHSAILDAIEAMDKPRTEATIRRHVSGVLDYLAHLQATRSELFEPLRPARPRRN